MKDQLTLPLLDVSATELPWKTPVKRIYSSQDVQNFLHSVAIDRIKASLFMICGKVSLVTIPNGVLDEKLVSFDHPKLNHGDLSVPPLDLPPPEQSFTVEKSPKSVKETLRLVEALNHLIDETPPFPGPRRYGNMACRDWHDKLETQIDTLLKSCYKEMFPGDPKQFDGFVSEARSYLLGSFGSRERLDYGTGHELSFLAFISSLMMCGIIDHSNTSGVEYLVIFCKYSDLVKRLILTYTLEPAGSHGVWGLDDHFHLVYILGASQLVDSLSEEPDMRSQKAIIFRAGLTPSSILNPDILRAQGTKNLYFNAISFIRKVKRGNFSEHSPLLYDISTSKSWEKIASGMIKMYYGEVLSKFPVVQHFLFGEVLFPWIDSKSHRSLPESSPEQLEEQKEGSGPGSDNYRSEAEIAMHSIYQRREEELAKLVDQTRLSPPKSLSTQRAPDLVSARGIKRAATDDSMTKNMQRPAVTRAPWAARGG